MSDSGPQPVAHPKSPGDLESRALERFVKRVRRRLVANRLLSHLATAVLVGVSLVAAFLLVDRLLLPDSFRPAYAGWIIGGTALVALIWTFVRRPVTLFHAAVAADRELDLRERVSTARSGLGGVDPEWSTLIVRDAEQSVETVRLANAFPVIVERRAAWILVPLFVSIGVFLWAPSLDPFGIKAEEAEAATVKKLMDERKEKLDSELEELQKKAEEAESEEARKLLKLLAEDIAKKKDPTNSEKRGENAGDQNRAKNDPHKNALLEMAKRESMIKKGLDRDQFRKLKNALKDLKGLDLRRAEKTRALQAALKDGDLAAAKRELDRLTKKIAELAKKPQSQLTKEEKELLKKLQEELARLAKDSGALAQLAPNLGNFGDMGSQGLQQMLQNMQQLGMDLDALKQLQNDMDFLKQALDMVQLSKQDLAKLSQHKCPNCGKNLGKKPGQPGGT